MPATCRGDRQEDGSILTANYSGRHVHLTLSLKPILVWGHISVRIGLGEFDGCPGG